MRQTEKEPRGGGSHRHEQRLMTRRVPMARARTWPRAPSEEHGGLTGCCSPLVLAPSELADEDRGPPQQTGPKRRSARGPLLKCLERSEANSRRGSELGSEGWTRTDPRASPALEGLAAQPGILPLFSGDHGPPEDPAQGYWRCGGELRPVAQGGLRDTHPRTRVDRSARPSPRGSLPASERDCERHISRRSRDTGRGPRDTEAGGLRDTWGTPKGGLRDTGGGDYGTLGGPWDTAWGTTDHCAPNYETPPRGLRDTLWGTTRHVPGTTGHSAGDHGTLEPGTTSHRVQT